MKKLWFIFLSVFQISAANITIPDLEYIKFTLTCIVEKTQEEGVHRLLEACQTIIKDLIRGEPFPRICEEGTFCSDLVCCPKNNEFSIPFLITFRESIQYKGCSGEDGVTQLLDVCVKRKRINEETKLCKFDICGEFVCCNSTYEEPITILEDINIKKFDDPPSNWQTCKNHKNIYDGVIGEPCTMKATGEAGTCRDKAQCPFYSNMDDKSKYIQLCGSDFCIVDMVCCPQIDFEKTTRNDHCKY